MQIFFRFISQAEYVRLLKSALRIQCKPELSKPEITHVFIKMSNFAGTTFPALKELFPDIQQMFITRRYKESLLSYFKIARGLPQIWIWLGHSYNLFLHHLSFPVEDPKWWDLYRFKTNEGFTYAEGLAFTYAGAIESFVRTRENYDHVMLYEDIKAEPEREARALFNALGLDEKYIPDALSAMREDAQQGVLGIRGTAHIELTPIEMVETDATFKMLDSPLTMNMTLEQLRSIIYDKRQGNSCRGSSENGIVQKTNLSKKQLGPLKS